MLYEEFISNILNIRGRNGCVEEYYETHHILPKCMGGSNDEENLIDLYAREHFMAHKLLAEENPHNNKLIYAFWMMTHCYGRSDLPRYECTPEEYEEAKIAFSIASSELHKGKHISDEQKSAISIRMSGSKHPLFGTRRSKETRQKISEHHADMSGDNNPNFGNYWSQEQKDALSLKVSGKNNSRSFEIYCPELDEEFWGAKEVEDKYGIKASNISACLHGRQKTAGKHPITGEKLHWVKVESKNC